MIEQIPGALASLKVAMDVTKGMVALKNQQDILIKTTELTQIIIDVQSQLLEAQAASAALSSRIRELEADQVKREQWAEEKTHYQLHKFPAGGIAYRFQPQEGDARPEHEVCASCADNGIKSILQPGTDSSSWHNILTCHACGGIVRVQHIGVGKAAFSVGSAGKRDYRDF